MSQKIFLSAHWQYLAMLNYEVDPAVLQPYLPPYTELDLFEGKALVSVVGFLFNDTRVLGVQWPFHTSFNEVNLRFYVKHFDGNKWKRGTAFISEIVPKIMIAKMANALYNEHYSTAKMFHRIEEINHQLLAEYRWKKRGEPWNIIKIKAANTATDITAGSEAEFILEHYFGYNMLNATTTIEYAVEHPRWQIFPVIDYSLQADIANLYGNAFAPFIQTVSPQSVFFAKGSPVIVRRPVKIKSAPLSK
jgi:uncharacterized protein YqjF (DUF2071 family)